MVVTEASQKAAAPPPWESAAERRCTPCPADRAPGRGAGRAGPPAAVSSFDVAPRASTPREGAADMQTVALLARARALGIEAAARAIVTETTGREQLGKDRPRVGRLAGRAASSVLSTSSRGLVLAVLARFGGPAGGSRRLAVDLGRSGPGPLRGAAKKTAAAAQPFDVAGGGQVERGHRRLLGLQAFSRAPKARRPRSPGPGCRAAPGELAEGLLAAGPQAVWSSSLLDAHRQQLNERIRAG